MAAAKAAAKAEEHQNDEGEEKEVKGIKMSEVEQHQSIDDLWLVIDGGETRGGEEGREGGERKGERGRAEGAGGSH